MQVSLIQIFFIALRLGCTSFGGPTAHLAYFQQTYVTDKKWLRAEEYADLVALSQFLPGPASSQVGIGIGFKLRGIIGSILAFIGFTLPSIVIMLLFAAFLQMTTLDLSWLQGLKLVAVAIVAHVIWDMSSKLLVSPQHIGLMVIVAVLSLLLKTPYAMIFILLGVALIGYFFFPATASKASVTVVGSVKSGGIALSVFFLLLFGLPLATSMLSNDTLSLFTSMYTAGALVFGGGHVVLPLLEAQFVQTGLMSTDAFLAGYSIAQAIPGPLFTFATYIGMVLDGVPGALIATVAIFLPAFLLIIGVYPFWLRMGQHTGIRRAMSALNAAVIGILVAAFLSPIVSSTVTSAVDALIALLLVTLLFTKKVSPLLLVLLGVVIGVAIY